MNADLMEDHLAAVRHTLAQIRRHRPDLTADFDTDLMHWTSATFIAFANMVQRQYSPWEQAIRDRLDQFFESARGVSDNGGAVFAPEGLGDAIDSDDLVALDRLLGVPFLSWPGATS